MPIPVALVLKVLRPLVRYVVAPLLGEAVARRLLRDDNGSEEGSEGTGSPEPVGAVVSPLKGSTEVSDENQGSTITAAPGEPDTVPDSDANEDGSDESFEVVDGEIRTTTDRSSDTDTDTDPEASNPGTPVGGSADGAPTFENMPAIAGHFTPGRRVPVSVIVLHYSATFTALQCFEILEKRGISVHVTTSRDGRHLRHVDDGDRAWHAGDGKWNGSATLNACSVGVEIANFGWVTHEWNGTAKGYKCRASDPEIYPAPDGAGWYRSESYTDSKGRRRSTKTITRQACAFDLPDHRESYPDHGWALYPEEQVEAVFALVWHWIKSHPNVLLENVVGHEHTNPGRKTDPGPAFPWKRLGRYLEARARGERHDLLDPNHRNRDRVRALQSHVSRLGLYRGDIDGLFGPLSKAALDEAWKQYGDVYDLDDVPRDPAHTVALCAALRCVPGFAIGR